MFIDFKLEELELSRLLNAYNCKPRKSGCSVVHRMGFPCWGLPKFENATRWMVVVRYCRFFPNELSTVIHPPVELQIALACGAVMLRKRCEDRLLIDFVWNERFWNFSITGQPLTLQRWPQGSSKQWIILQDCSCQFDEFACNLYIYTQHRQALHCREAYLSNKSSHKLREWDFDSGWIGRTSVLAELVDFISSVLQSFENEIIFENWGLVWGNWYVLWLVAAWSEFLL